MATFLAHEADQRLIWSLTRNDRIREEFTKWWKRPNTHKEPLSLIHATALQMLEGMAPERSKTATEWLESIKDEKSARWRCIQQAVMSRLPGMMWGKA